MRGSSCDLPKITSDDVQIAKPCVSSSTLRISFVFLCLPSLYFNRTTKTCLCHLIFPCSNAAKVWHHSGTKVPFLPLCGRRRWWEGTECRLYIQNTQFKAQNILFIALTWKSLHSLPFHLPQVLHSCFKYRTWQLQLGWVFSPQCFRFQRLGSLIGPQHKPHQLTTKASLLPQPVFFLFLLP